MKQRSDSVVCVLAIMQHSFCALFPPALQSGHSSAMPVGWSAECRDPAGMGRSWAGDGAANDLVQRYSQSATSV